MSKSPDTRAHVCCYTCWLAAPAHDASRPAPAAAGSARAVAAAHARMLRTLRLLLLLSPHVLRLRLHRRECVWGCPATCERERVGAQRTYRVDPSWMLHHGGPSLEVQGLLVLRPLGAGLLWRSACVHALLTRECLAIWTLTARWVHARLLELARMTVIGSIGWVRAARACPWVRARGQQHLLQRTKTRWNNWNIRLQHMCITNTTYNNVQIKLLQHTSKKGETF
jgi:hypothetical protein